MLRKHSLIRGTFFLTLAGLLCRLTGFFYRIFLSRIFKAEGVGLYQLIFPIFTLCFAFCASGIQSAISRAVAQRNSNKGNTEAERILLCGLGISIILSLICFFFLQRNAGFIACKFLGDPRCEPLLILLSYALPFCAVHSCICGYCYGKHEVHIPAFSQLIEQFSRILFVFFLYLLIKNHCRSIPIEITAAGIAAGEFCSCAYCIYRLNKKKIYFFSSRAKLSHDIRYIKELLSLCVPLSFGRILLTFLQSIEAVSIPAGLRLYGFGADNALGIYGVLTGMALPCIFFPSAATNSLATLLLPAVAEIQAADKKTALAEVIKKVSLSCIALGLGCCLFFLVSGRYIGTVLFHSADAGKFILTLAWICPFLYVNTAFASVLNGLGKAALTFLINAAGLLVRISGIFFLIPVFGITGYLWGLLASQFILSFLFVLALSHTMKKRNA